MSKKIPVTLLLNKVIVDRNSYKPYVSELASPLERPVYVRVMMDDTDIDEHNKDIVVLTVDGLANLMGRIADSIDKMHEKHVEKIVKG